MTWIGDKAHCDGCGVDLGNASLVQCSVHSRIKPGTGDVENLHFCLDREEKGDRVKGCDSKLLTPSKMEDYHARQQEKEDQEPQEAQDGGIPADPDPGKRRRDAGADEVRSGRTRGRKVDGDGRRGRSHRKSSGSGS